MTIKYGFLNYDEPKKKNAKETPKKFYDFNVKDFSDIRSVATALSEDVYENLAGKEKFRFFITGENKTELTYQVNLTKEPRDFFEAEILDDVSTILKVKRYY